MRSDKYEMDAHEAEGLAMFLLPMLEINTVSSIPGSRCA